MTLRWPCLPSQLLGEVPRAGGVIFWAGPIHGPVSDPNALTGTLTRLGWNCVFILSMCLLWDEEIFIHGFPGNVTQQVHETFFAILFTFSPSYQFPDVFHL